MIELRSDIARRVALDDASADVRKNGPALYQQESMNDRLNALREKQNRPKRKLPWFTIISVVSCVPMLFMDGMNPMAMMGGRAPQTQGQALEKSVNNAGAGETATVSVNIGGKTFTKQISASDLQAMQGGAMPPSGL